MSQAISNFKATRLFLGLRLRRSANFIRSAFNIFGRKSAKRKGTAGKGKAGFLVVFIALYLIGMIIAVAYSSGNSLAQSFPLPLDFARALGIQFAWQIFFTGLSNASSRELGHADTDIEWLSTLPAPLPILLIGKVIERGFANIWMIVIVATYAGAHYFAGKSGLNIGLSVLFFIVPLLFLSGMFQVAAEYFLRMKLAPHRLRNFQAVMSAVGIVPVMISVSPGFGGIHVWKAALAHLPEWTYWLAPFLIGRIGIEPDLSTPLAAVLIVLQFAVLFLVAYAALSRILRIGGVASSQRTALARGSERKLSRWDRFIERFPPILRRELRLLARDQTYLVQTIVVPLGLMFYQLYSFVNMSSETRDSYAFISTMLFFGMCYILAFSSFQAINSEGRSLWIISTLPITLEDLLKSKLRLWRSFAYTVMLGILIFAHVKMQMPWTIRQAYFDGAILLGGYIYSWIAVSIGVFSSNPLAEDVQKRFKPSSMYFFLGLISLYVPVFQVESYWFGLVLIVLLSSFAYAIWEEAKSYLPYILDPVAALPSIISFTHGSLFATLFFLVQALFFWIFAGRDLGSTTHWLLSFASAGAIVLAIMTIYFKAKKTQNLPPWSGPFTGRSVGLGVVLGLGAALVAILYLKLNGEYQWFPVESFRNQSTGLWALMALAVIAAPPIEEYIFRGVLFQGLMRSFRPSLAIVMSATLFAMVHPVSSFVPVFCLGLATAFLFRRTGNLTAPIVCHAVYNFALVGLSVLNGTI